MKTFFCSLRRKTTFYNAYCVCKGGLTHVIRGAEGVYYEDRELIPKIEFIRRVGKKDENKCGRFQSKEMERGKSKKKIFFRNMINLERVPCFL